VRALFAGAVLALSIALASPNGPWAATFVDVAASAGLRHPSIYGGVEQKRFIIETNGAGVALLDLDNDGWLDALVLSGTRLEDGARRDRTWPSGEAPTNRLYRNNHDGTFSDVTAKSGLGRTGWASSVCAGDYDNDGWTDLFLTYYGRNVLFHNRGDGTFEDVTASAGFPTTGTRWGSGCSFFDYDRDGKADLFVANYLSFDLAGAPEPGQGVNCLWKGIAVNCGPKGLPTDTNLLYHNEGGGRFKDVSEASGVAKVTGRYAMTAAAADFDGDGWIDVYVACDSTAAILYRNNRDGTFTDVAMASGVAYSEYGNPQAGMGLGVGDVDADGRLDLFKTHFADDVPALYRNLGRGLFEDVATSVGLAVQNRYVQWGGGVHDLDNDGWPDLLYVTGNVYPEIERQLKDYPHRGPRIVFHNRGGASFEDVSARSGPGATTPHSSRGAAFGDFDNDGDLDVLVMNMNEPPSLLRNDLPPQNAWIQVRLQGTRSDRMGLGATVTVTTGERKQAQALLSQGSYYSVDDTRLHFGLGTADKADRIEVRWPSGQVDTLEDVAGRRVVTIREGGALVTPILDLDEHAVDPLAIEGRASVLVFVRTDCPISNRYAPEIRRLQERFAARGAAFWLVYADAAQPVDAIRAHLRAFDLPVRALRDSGHVLVRKAGARVTPEAAVFVPGDGGARLAYRGRIDDRYLDFDRMRAAPTTHDLEDALEAVLAGRAVPRETTTAVGCFLADVE
jgi:enediyne biosynthesis protein E4